MRNNIHILSGVVMCEGYLCYNNIRPVEIFAGFNKYSQAIIDLDFLFFFIPVFTAIIFGSVFPDIDIHIGKKNIDRKGKIWPSKLHRTIFHWWPVYLFGLLCSVFYGNPIYISFFVACLIHLFLDSFTKTGIPLKKPFGKKSGFKIIKVGHISELPVFIILVLIMLLLA